MITKNSAKQNITALPESCYAILLRDRSLIKITAGVSGYRSMKGYPHTTNTDKFADKLNTEIGVTRGQREAMEIGSMWGWDVPGANPDNYNDDGTPNWKE